MRINLRKEKPSDYLINSLKKTEKDRKRGRYRSFKRADKALGFIDGIINENKKN